MNAVIDVRVVNYTWSDKGRRERHSYRIELRRKGERVWKEVKVIEKGRRKKK
jgi:hypothetical protein